MSRDSSSDDEAPQEMMASEGKSSALKLQEAERDAVSYSRQQGAEQRRKRAERREQKQRENKAQKLAKQRKHIAQHQQEEEEKEEDIEEEEEKSQDDDDNVNFLPASLLERVAELEETDRIEKETNEQRNDDDEESGYLKFNSDSDDDNDDDDDENDNGDGYLSVVVLRDPTRSREAVSNRKRELTSKFEANRFEETRRNTSASGGNKRAAARGLPAANFASSSLTHGNRDDSDDSTVARPRHGAQATRVEFLDRASDRRRKRRRLITQLIH
jgi:hypothetical protein